MKMADILDGLLLRTLLHWLLPAMGFGVWAALSKGIEEYWIFCRREQWMRMVCIGFAESVDKHLRRAQTFGMGSLEAGSTAKSRPRCYEDAQLLLNCFAWPWFAEREGDPVWSSLLVLALQFQYDLQTWSLHIASSFGNRAADLVCLDEIE